jgi:hypothetical protein
MALGKGCLPRAGLADSGQRMFAGKKLDYFFAESLSLSVALGKGYFQKKISSLSPPGSSRVQPSHTRPTRCPHTRAQPAAARAPPPLDAVHRRRRPDPPAAAHTIPAPPRPRAPPPPPRTPHGRRGPAPPLRPRTGIHASATGFACTAPCAAAAALVPILLAYEAVYRIFPCRYCDATGSVVSDAAGVSFPVSPDRFRAHLV